ncbi:RING/U-box [Ramicandelaber brevisporus]|nr:RING/U-box [Ramicandelaber brevisporus]
MRVVIRRWNAAASWRWDIDGKRLAGDDDDDDICGICQNAYESTCSNDCALPGDGCPLVWGDCSHVFHKHCLTKWLDSSNKGQCPLDRQPWVTKIST